MRATWTHVSVLTAGGEMEVEGKKRKMVMQFWRSMRRDQCGVESFPVKLASFNVFCLFFFFK